MYYVSLLPRAHIIHLLLHSYEGSFGFLLFRSYGHFFDHLVFYFFSPLDSVSGTSSDAVGGQMRLLLCKSFKFKIGIFLSKNLILLDFFPQETIKINCFLKICAPNLFKEITTKELRPDKEI